jgi:hypothetical protein
LNVKVLLDFLPHVFLWFAQHLPIVAIGAHYVKNTKRQKPGP